MNIEDEMKSSYIDYSMSVIVSRALPDVRDGFKPVHRRILYGMWDMGITHEKATKKSAAVVGEVLGKYHPHGDSSVYNALVRMALKLLLLPRDPNDRRNVIMELRGGVGGEESALFAHYLLRMYTMYAQSKGWKLDIVNLNETELGGVKECSVLIEGEGAFSRLKFESGVHRVQRVPETESGGRIHTSAATVAVLPEAEEVEVAIDPKDLQIDTYRSSGAGGQHVNKTESAIRITHLPTGLVVECQDERSQYKNKDKAMKVLRSRLYEMERAKQDAAIAGARKSQVGSGDRSERIRTYNFPQGRVTDHRLGLTLYKIDAIMDGDLDELIDALITADQAEKLKNGEA